MRICCNLRSFWAVFAVFVATTSANAQVAPIGKDSGVQSAVLRVAARGQMLQGNSVIDGQIPTAHYCGTDFSSASARASHDAYHLAKRSGTQGRASKYLIPPVIGEEREFRILDQYGTPSAKWMPTSFRLVAVKPDFYYLWVDVNELAEGFVSQQDISTMQNALGVQTPTGSINPSRGIIENNEFYFGPPPDVDLDGHTDILVYDIDKDGIGGFVSLADVDPTRPDTVGNHADVLHIDARQSSNGLAAIAAHEYTHLQHISSEWDFDYTFVTEGYAEYAMILNGYVTRTIDYLNVIYENTEGQDEFEYTRPLFDWRLSPNNGGPSARDYQRGGLFFTYIANQQGPEIVGGMLKGERKGPAGIDSVLVEVGSSINETIRDFHTANLVNNTSLDSRFGYIRPGRTQLHASVTQQIDGEVKRVDPEGIKDYAIYRYAQSVEAGAVQYIQWVDVADFTLVIDADSYQTLPISVRDRERIFQQSSLILRVIGERTDGTKLIQDINASAAYQRFNGRFRSLTVMVSRSTEYGFNFLYEAQWTPLSQAPTSIEGDALPATTVLHQNYPNPFNPRTIIPFSLSRAGMVRLSVHDMLGRTVAVLRDENLGAGLHEVVLDASLWASGNYFYRLDADGHVDTKSMQVIR